MDISNKQSDAIKKILIFKCDIAPSKASSLYEEIFDILTSRCDVCGGNGEVRCSSIQHPLGVDTCSNCMGRGYS